MEGIEPWLGSRDLQSWSQIVLSLVTVIATIVLGRATVNLTRETKSLAERTAQPFVTCTLESGKSSSVALNQVVRNTGNGTAFDIEVRFSPLLPKIGDGPEPDHRTISILPPGRALSVHGASSMEILGERYFVTVSWADTPKGPRHSLGYNLTAADGFRAGWTEYGLHEISNSIKELQKDVRSVISGSRRLGVDSFDQEDREREEADQKKWREEWQAAQQQRGAAE